MDSRNVKMIKLFLLISHVILTLIVCFAWLKTESEYSSFQEKVKNEHGYLITTKELYFKKIGEFYILVENDENERASSAMRHFLENLGNLERGLSENDFYNLIINKLKHK